MKTRFLAAAALLCSMPFASHAADGTDAAISECVTLGSGKQIVRSDNGEHFLLKHGDAHYRVIFHGKCDSIAYTSKLEISTAGEPDQLCPAGTKVRTSHALCDVGKVERIEAGEFASRKRARR